MHGREFIDFEEVAILAEARSRSIGGTRRPLGPRSRVAIATAALTLLVAPLAAGAAGGPELYANSGGEPFQVRTDLPGDYALRVANTGADGSAARLTCDSPKRCVLVGNARGPAAKFEAGPGAPPFEVTSKQRVDRLNADRLDGRTASEIVEEAIELGAGGRTPAGPAGGDLTGLYPDPEIAASAVGTAEIADGSIVAADVAAANVDGAAGVPSLRSLGTAAGQAAAGNDPRLSDSRAPSGPAGGDLTGTYPSPTLGNGSIDSTGLFAPSLQDGAAGTATLRSLGTGAQQAAAGNDSRLSDARTPTGPAGGELDGTYPNPTLRGDSVDSGTVVNRSLRLTDTAVFASAVTIGTFQLAANSCASFQGSASEILAGDVVELYPPVDGTDNALGVVWTSGTQDGDGIFKVVACNNNSSAASAGGTIPIFAFRP